MIDCISLKPQPRRKDSLKPQPWAEVIALKPSVEACNRSWPHDRVEVWEACFVAFDFNRDDFLCTFFYVHRGWRLSVVNVLLGGSSII